MRGRARGRLPGERTRRKPKTAKLPPPPPAEHGGIGPEGGGTEREGRAPTPGGGSPGHRSGRGRAGEGGPRPGFPVTRPPPQAARAPERGTSLTGRPSPDAESRSLETSKPEERPPPVPEASPPAPGLANLFPSLAGAGGRGGRELWGGEGRSPRGPGSATSLAKRREDRKNWEEGEQGEKRAVTPLGAFCQRRRECGMAEQKKRVRPGNSPL